jgi:hypothetical protein
MQPTYVGIMLVQQHIGGAKNVNSPAHMQL